MGTLEIIFIIIGILIVVISAFFFTRKRTTSERTEGNLYTRGLDHMIRGENQAAIRLFKKYVRKNTENIEVYIKLGMLFRKTDQSEKSVKLNENLLYRPNLSVNQKIAILSEIVEGYRDLGKKEAALASAQKILEIDKNHQWAIDVITRLHQEIGNWEQAAEYLKKSATISKSTKARSLAIFKVQEGLKKYKTQAYHDSRLLFRKAIKLDPNCEAPYYYIADSYVKDNREQDAIQWWEKFILAAPDRAGLIFPVLKKTLFKLGRYEELVAFYHKILKKRPHDMDTNIALAEFNERKGKVEKAVSIMETLVEKHPQALKPKLALIGLLISEGDPRAARDTLNSTIEALEKENSYRCSDCGYVSTQIRWLCPQCRAIDTFIDR